jgi:hypothetical protein
MIEKVTLRISGNDEPPLFEVGYVDLERKGQKNYFWTTKYGTETKMRIFLKLCGVSAPEIDRLFDAANL